MEGGPFSERTLFDPKIPEKKLQLWLAARLNDTPMRKFKARFGVHREPEVDLSKRTDIEVSSAAGKVCIEIKPVGRHRNYTPASLTKTLRVQLVGQYLRGKNSKHGILVLVQLDRRTWRLPQERARGKTAGTTRASARATFTDLVRYLQCQADLTRSRSSQVEQLRVLGMDCSLPR